MLLVNINAQAQASAESLPTELSRVDFHSSRVYPMCFPICSRFREASTLQRTEQNFVLASSRLPQYYRLAPQFAFFIHYMVLSFDVAQRILSKE